MTEKYSKSHLDLIEDMAMRGLSLEDISEYFGMTLIQGRKWMSENLEIKKAIKAGQERAKMFDLDAQRRSRLDRLASFFIPTDAEVATIEELARLGWSEVKIAEQFDLAPATFLAAKKKYPELEEAIQRGMAQSEGRRVKSDLKEWKPSPYDLERIEQFAEEGLTLDSVAAEMGIPVTALNAKKEEIPEIEMAFRTGFAKLKAQVERKAAELAKRGNERILPLWLKTRDKENWTEGAAKEVKSVSNMPTTGGPVLNLPTPVDAESFEKTSAKFRKEKRIADANAE